MTRIAPTPVPDQRGGGSVLMIAGCLVVTMVGYAALIICGYLIAAHQARAAADLASLSAATEASLGGEPCAVARRIARAHRAEIATCERVGDQIDFVITVTAQMRVSMKVPGLPRQVAATSYAGPKDIG
ncbi:MAG: hypothetical protein L0H41_14800 [Microlunatus sp.]|nr:hypothetical protein [Microlunatus sp.]MDN5804364.1 hypothetical protein [Microlunatus sp.]